jgi:phage shock protein E
VIDVRTPQEFAKGHVAGAVNIPVSEIETRIAEVASKETPLLVHCQSGGRSARATAALRNMGYTKVKDLGGYANAKATVEGGN